LDKYNPDIVILSEWSATKREYTYLPNKLHNPFTLFQRQYSIYHNSTDVALLIKKTINHVPLKRKYTHKEDIRENIHTCAIQITNGNETFIIGGYYCSPSFPSTTKPQQLIDYMNTLYGDKKLFIGDMNIHHPKLGDDYACSMAEPFMTDIEESMYSIYNDPHSPTHQDGGHLDLIIGSDNQTHNLNKITVHPDWNQSHLNSDHFPITISYQLTDKSLPRKKYKTWNLNSNRWTKYKSILQTHFHPTHFKWKFPNDIDKTWDNILSLWTRITHSTIGKKTIYTKPTPWWTKKVENITKQYKRLSRKIQRKRRNKKKRNKPTPEDLSQLAKLLKRKKKVIKQAKRNLNRNIYRAIKNNSHNSTFWKAVGGFQPKQPTFIPNLQNNLNIPNTEVLSTDKQKVEAIHKIIKNPPQPTQVSPLINNHYRKVQNWYTDFKNTNATNSPEYKIDFNHQATPFIQSCTTPIWDPNSSRTEELNRLNKPITLQELNICIRELEHTKAMGEDLIHNKMIKNAPMALRTILLTLFNRCWMNKVTPSKWHIDSIIPIPKPNRDPTHPKNYRPIAISSTVGRLLQRIIAKRLQQYTIKLGVFQPTQSGFQMARSCIDAILPLYQTIIQTEDIKSSTQLLQTDFAKAYDTVWHQGLIYKLYHMGIRGTILKWLDHFVSNRITQVLYNDTKSAPFKQQIGLPQGSSLSPILYILYTHDYKLSPLGNKTLFQGCFADDTIFWNKPCSKQFFDKYIPKIMMHEYSHFKQWATKWKLVLSPEKNKWTCFQKTPETSDSKQPSVSNPYHNPLSQKRDNNVVAAHIRSSDYLTNEILNEHKNMKDPLVKDPNALENIYKNPQLTTEEQNYLNSCPIPQLTLETTPIYLGIRLNEDNSFQSHMNHIIKTTYYHKMNLKQLIAKRLPISLATLLIIYTSKIRSRIEYGIEIYHPYVKDNLTQKIQNQSLRMILNCPKTIPIPIIHFLTQLPTIQQRYEYYNIKNYIRTQYTVPNHTLNLYKQEYKHYTDQTNNPNIQKIINWQNKKPQKHLNFFTKHPLTIAENQLRQYNLPITNRNHAIPINPQITTSLPYTDFDKPPSLYIKNYNIKKDKQYPKNWNVFYADGSALGNPGRGGGCWGLTQHPKLNSKQTLYKLVQPLIPYEINFYELYTIHKIIQFLIDNPQVITPITIIHTDSKNALDWLNQHSQPNHLAHQHQINQIYYKIYYLEHNYKIQQIILQKIKAHSHSFFHNQVDKKAKIAANNMIILPHMNSYLPYYIQINYLKKLLKTQKHQNWTNYRNTYLKNIKTQPTKLNRPIVYAFKHHNYKLLKYLNKITNHTHRGLITQLITGETPTNDYFFRYPFYKMQHNNGNCIYCETYYKNHIKETTNHILFHCPQYSIIRSDFRTEIGYLNNKYNHDPHWNLNNLLFPWMNEHIIPKNQKDKITLHIWKLLIQYCKRTQNRAFSKDNPLLR